MLAPMTFIVTLILILAVVVGVLVLLKAFGTGKSKRDDVALGTNSPCAHCGRSNPTHARFCGHCGKALG